MKIINYFKKFKNHHYMLFAKRFLCWEKILIFLQRIHVAAIYFCLVYGSFMLLFKYILDQNWCLMFLWDLLYIKFNYGVAFSYKIFCYWYTKLYYKLMILFCIYLTYKKYNYYYQFLITQQKECFMCRFFFIDIFSGILVISTVCFIIRCIFQYFSFSILYFNLFLCFLACFFIYSFLGCVGIVYGKKLLGYCYDIWINRTYKKMLWSIFNCCFNYLKNGYIFYLIVIFLFISFCWVGFIYLCIYFHLDNFIIKIIKNYLISQNILDQNVWVVFVGLGFYCSFFIAVWISQKFY